MNATLFRGPSEDWGTRGLLHVTDIESSLVLPTLELPWRDNQRNVSCIPQGLYTVTPYKSSRFGDSYLVQDVPGRSGILFHYGNWAGDVSKGLKSNVEGCILVGTGFSERGQPMLTHSRRAYDRLKMFVGGSTFELEII